MKWLKVHNFLILGSSELKLITNEDDKGTIKTVSILINVILSTIERWNKNLHVPVNTTNSVVCTTNLHK